jgi:nucleotide-binding universal stress UspA family protein
MVDRTALPLCGGTPLVIGAQPVLPASLANLVEDRAVEDLDVQVPDAVPVAWLNELGSQPTSPSHAGRPLGPKVFLATGRGSTSAIETAARMATATGAVRAVLVRKRIPTAMGPFYYETVQQAATRPRAIMAHLQAGGIASISGVVAAAYCRLIAERVVGEAETWGADQIVVGRRGPSRYLTALLGGTSARVARMASCPVIVAARAIPAGSTRADGSD